MNGIYKIENKLNGVVYVGSTNDFEKRKLKHTNDLNNNRHHNTLLQNEWNKDGNCNFTFKMIEEIDDESLFPNIEKQYIDIYKNHKGAYNVSDPTKETASFARYKKLGRASKKPNNRDKNTYVYTAKDISKYLDENFKEFAELMKSNIKSKVYFNKRKVDKWILNHIKDVNVLNDSRVNNLIENFYTDNKYKIISSDGYKSHIEHLYKIKVVEEDEDIIISLDAWRKIRNRKNDILNMKRCVK